MRVQRTRSASLRSPLTRGPLGRSIAAWGIFAVLSVGSGCGLVPERVSLTDPKIRPMIKAMEAVDRQSLGFSAVEPDARVRLEWGPRHGYDAMLHIYGSTSRTVAFRRAGGGYRWISEQELHYGPRIWKTEDGDVREFIAVEYQTEPINGIPLNQVYVRYTGDDPRLADRKVLKLAEAEQCFREWQGTRWQ